MTFAIVFDREDHKAAIRGRTFQIMNQQTASTNLEQRRGIRRTVLVMAAVALTIFVLFFMQQALWR